MQETIKIIQILEKIKSKITKNSSIIWTNYSSPKEINKAIEDYIIELNYENFKVLKQIAMDFAPAETFQELSISDAWEDEYFSLSKEFDRNYSNIIEKINKQG